VEVCLGGELEREYRKLASAILAARELAEKEPGPEKREKRRLLRLVFVEEGGTCPLRGGRRPASSPAFW